MSTAMELYQLGDRVRPSAKGIRQGFFGAHGTLPPVTGGTVVGFCRDSSCFQVRIDGRKTKRTTMAIDFWEPSGEPRRKMPPRRTYQRFAHYRPAPAPRLAPDMAKVSAFLRSRGLA